LSLEIVSVHFPKTAGTSLAEGLRRHYGDTFTLDYNHSPVDPTHLVSEPPSLPEGTRAVHGHFRGDRYLEDRSAFRFTFLRDPVANLISIYFFWRAIPSTGLAPHDRFLIERPSIIDFARGSCPLRRLMSLTFFGGVDMASFDFVGFHETRERDLARLSKLVGIPFEADLHLNPTSAAELGERAAMMQDANTLGMLRTILADDVAFYEAVRQRWD
jgi:hypothetical protein